MVGAPWPLREMAPIHCQPVDQGVAGVGDRLWSEADGGVGRRGRGGGRRQAQEVGEGLGFVAGRRLDLGQVRAERGKLHEHVAQEDTAGGGGAGSGLDAAFCNSSNCCLMSAGQAALLFADTLDGGAEGGGVSQLGGDAA